MTGESPPQALSEFVDFFGDLGHRWGLPADACRIHAYLYVRCQPVSQEDIESVLSIDGTSLSDAISFLDEYELITRTGSNEWRTSDDPWEMLSKGLEQRRRREVPAAISSLTKCHTAALADKEVTRVSTRQMEKMLELVKEFAALDSQVQRLSPQLVRGVFKVSGIAARIMDRTLGPPRRN